MNVLLPFALVALLAAGASSSGDKPPAMPPPSPEDLITRSTVLIGSGDFAGAEKAARDGLKMFPKAQGFHLTLGEIFFKQGKYADAYYEYQWEFDRTGASSLTGANAAARIKQIVLQTRGTDTNEVLEVLDAMSESLKDPKKSIQRIQKVQRERGDRFALKVAEAEALTNAQDWAGAESAYRDVLRRDPTFVGGYVQMAGVLDHLGKDKESGQMMAKAKDIDPDNWQLQTE